MKRRLRKEIKFFLAALVIASLVVFSLFGILGHKSVSDKVLEHKPMILQYAKQYGISSDLDILLAIVQVETAGEAHDVMQSSESMGLSPNSLNVEESIEQGCRYYAELKQYAKSLNLDENSVIQAYNYGPEFLNYVYEHGGRFTEHLAASYAEKMSDGVTVSYLNPIAVKKNGGWRYAYGNMFYVTLVRQYS